MAPGRRFRSSGDYTSYRSASKSPDSAHQRAFFTVLLVVTVTCLVLVISALSVFAYFRVTSGPLQFGKIFKPSCPGNQEWTECGYACNLTCAEQVKVCAAVCVEGCECPDNLPLWHQDRCIARHQCPFTTENTTSSLNGHFMKNSPTVVASDTLHIQDAHTPPDTLSQFMQTLWQVPDSQLNSSHFIVNLQGQTQPTLAVDQAQNRLFDHVEYKSCDTLEIYSTFIDLLGKFNKHVNEADIMTTEKQRAINNFLDSILSGEVMKKTESFLKEQGLLGEQSFRELLHSIWFDVYPRSTKYNTTDSSGFEHVFVGEVRGWKILGLHNWIQFFLLEKHQELDYYGYIKDVCLPSNKKLIGVNVQFVWDEQRKRQGSFLVGTSPDLDLAVYTVCFLLHPDRRCSFNLQGLEVSVQTKDVKHVPGWQIGTAYPIF